MRKKTIKHIAIIALAYLSVWSCIEPFDLPNVANDFVSSIVVDGTISNDDSIQTITISETRPLNSPQSNVINTLAGCKVSVTDKDGVQFEFTETDKEGVYQSIIPEQYFYEGNTFQLSLITPNDNVYSSEEEALLAVSPVDSIYFTKVINSQGSETGVKFKVDVNGELSDSRNYKWKLVETYEYHASYPIHFIYRGDIDNPEIRDYDMSQYTCYKTNKITGEIYMVSTDKLSENRYIGVPLNYVTYSTGKLKEKYSLLVKQYSLSKGAARFWSQMQSNQEDEGMFDGQPITVEGNIWNINNTDERVLGYFGASMVSQKRVFAQSSSNYSSSCRTTLLSQYVLDSLVLESSNFSPLYVVKTYAGPGSILQMYTAPAACFECTKSGGTTGKPYYWDDEDIIELLTGVE